MIEFYVWMTFASMAISLASISTTAHVIVRARRHRCPTPTAAGVVFRATDRSVVAVLQPDGSIEVLQPDRIRAAGDARQAAEKEFGGAP